MTMADLALFETLRFEPGEGFPRKDLHAARIARSAQALGLPFRACDFEAALETVPADQGARRVRLELSATGDMGVTHAPFTPLQPGTIWRVAIAETRLSSGDPLLRHKTTRRAHYIAARAEFPAEAADEVLLLNEEGAVCEGTITSLFLPDGNGMLLTPPLGCGLLAGVLRQALLEAGKAREARLLPGDLEGRDFFVGNSLRGLISARLA